MRLAIAAFTVALLASMCIVTHASAYPQPLLTAKVVQFTEMPSATVECAVGVSGGGADIIDHEVFISSPFCNPLLILSAGQERFPVRQGVGLIILTHEAIHLTGILNEAQTECYALQRLDEMAALFNVRSGYLPALWHYAYEDSMALQKTAPRYRNRRLCRPNGLWDLTPLDGRWP